MNEEIFRYQDLKITVDVLPTLIIGYITISVLSFKILGKLFKTDCGNIEYLTAQVDLRENRQFYCVRIIS